MVDTARALARSNEVVEKALQRTRQAGVLDSIEPTGHIIWLTCYVAFSGLVFLLLWISFKESMRVPDQHDR